MVPDGPFNHWDSLPNSESAFPGVSRWTVVSFVKRGSSNHPGLPLLPQAPYSASDRPGCFVQHLFTRKPTTQQAGHSSSGVTGVSRIDAVPPHVWRPYKEDN